jgi:monovalent cation/proton antiporter MnhG/PhaG subunit
VTHFAALVLLAVGVAFECLCALGVLVMRDRFQRLHYANAAGSIGALVVVVAVVTEQGFDGTGLAAIVVGLTLVVTGPFATQAIARAARVPERPR